MKKSILLSVLLYCFVFAYTQNVGIGTTNPSKSAKLEINSTNQGFLPPRMTEAQRNAIASPALGLVIFNTTTNCLNLFIGSLWNEICGNGPFPINAVHCSVTPTAVVDVVNPITKKTWMDRNLGASSVATSSTDTASYGDLYQWGRRADGHQCRNSATTNVVSSTDQPAHGNFILGVGGYNDWRVPENSNLWQGVYGINNPCPNRYRLPTEAEFAAERASWSSDNALGAYNSPLKLPLAGSRDAGNGSINFVGSSGFYFIGTVDNTDSYSLHFGSGDAFITSVNRNFGGSVRCIKD